MLKLYRIVVFFLLVYSLPLFANTRFSYAPIEEEVLVFVGQDNYSVGRNGKYRTGYVDKVGVPAGITHYIYFSPGWTNNSGVTFPKDKVAGLNYGMDWGAGYMSLRDYLESKILDQCLVHVSISMEGNNEDKVASGELDYMIEELALFLKEFSDRKFLIRIGYEFDGPWNDYDAGNFKKAFIRIVDHLNERKLTNFSTVMASYGRAKDGVWETYYPGDKYVDWIGYSYFEHGAGSRALAFARQKNKPVFIAEAAPRGFRFHMQNGEHIWEAWFKGFFAHVESNLDVVNAISYIDCNWELYPRWQDGTWGNTKLDYNDYVRAKWCKKVFNQPYANVHDLENIYLNR